MDIQIINPITYPGWDDIILSFPDYSFFHSSAWAEVLHKSYGYTPVYFTLFEGKKIVAVLPTMEVKSLLTGTRGVSLPFTDYCEPLTNGTIPFTQIFSYAVEYGRKQGWETLELRGGRSPLGEAPSSEIYLTHLLDLSEGEEMVFARLKDSTRRNVRKAMAEGVKVMVDRSPEGLDAFCRLNSLTRKRHGLPPQPAGFFGNLYDKIISQNLGFVVTGSLGGKPIASAMFLLFGEKAVYKYGASDLKYQNVRANNLVMWEAIRSCCRSALRNLSLGRSEPENLGLIRFKSGWGALERKINYYRYDLKRQAFVSGYSRVTGLQKKIFEKIPLPILNRVGAMLYRHVV